MQRFMAQLHKWGREKHVQAGKSAQMTKHVEQVVKMSRETKIILQKKQKVSLKPEQSCRINLIKSCDEAGLICLPSKNVISNSPIHTKIQRHNIHWHTCICSAGTFPCLPPMITFCQDWENPMEFATRFK